MKYRFHSYINPIWFFHLDQNAQFSAFPDPDLLEMHQKELLVPDQAYSSNLVTKWDAAYQAWHKGIIVRRPDCEPADVNPGIADEYRFVKKYFHPIWAIYVLFIRLVSLHNPIVEIAGFLKAGKVKRVNLYKSVENHAQSIASFNSALLASEPLVSVVIPTLNRYTYLKDVLQDLEKQDYKNLEVIVVDQSDPFNQHFYGEFNLNLQLIHQKEKALWLARNTAILQAKGDFILLFDDDSRVEPDWVRKHLLCLDYFDAAISSGVSLSAVGDKIPANYSFYRWGDQLDTGNVMIRREVFIELGLFDRQFERQRMGDAEFGIRAHIHGKLNISNPEAKRIHLKVGEGGLRQMGSWDAFRPKKITAPRPIPSVLYLIRSYFGKRAALLSLVKNVPLSAIPYRLKGRRELIPIGIIIVALLSPLVFIQVLRSWNISSAMLKKGPLIQKIQSEI